jgi:hypothetical protein
MSTRAPERKPSAQKYCSEAGSCTKNKHIQDIISSTAVAPEITGWWSMNSDE